MNSNHFINPIPHLYFTISQLRVFGVSLVQLYPGWQHCRVGKEFSVIWVFFFIVNYNLTASKRFSVVGKKKRKKEIWKIELEATIRSYGEHNTENGRTPSDAHWI